MRLALKPLPLAIALVTAPLFSHADDAATALAPVVVTGEAMDAPLTVETDPKTPRQPVPAHDGADYLKTIPGFAVTRKGGTDGDAVFRGMAASRLGILVDGENVLGGCNSRMDAPTAYIYPETYDQLTVIKGPQTVVHGPGNSAATVIFERDIKRFEHADVRVYTSALAGSAGRADVSADVQAGNRDGFLQVAGSDSRADDYRDGDGERLHTEYHRYNGNIAFGLTPDAHTRAEINVTQSDGEAAYADRAMDGTQFLRQSQNIRLERHAISSLVDKLEFAAYQSHVDHIMDDQELREPGMMGYSNPERNSTGGRLAATLLAGDDNEITTGVDAQNNEHRSRTAGTNRVYTPWQDDANFNQQGLFVENLHLLDEKNRLIAGYRADRWEVTDERPEMIMIRMMPMTMVANPSAGDTRVETLDSGFLRLEHDFSHATVYTGLGYAERFPDYWELIAKRGEESVSAFDTSPEKTRQLDIGALYRKDALEISASAFYGKVADFILIDYSQMGAMNGLSRNIDATTYGSELVASYLLSTRWKVDSSLAWTWGSNDTDETALAQLPPLEGRVGVTYSDNDWSVGGLLRVVDDQDRYDLGRGTVVGQDFAPTGGFSVLSVNGSWQVDKTTQWSAGIDNALNKTYAEFISRTGSDGMGSAIPGYAQTERVNEPGRTLWTRLQIKL